MTSDKAIFLDRDGTLIIEKNYLANPADIAFEKEIIPALQRLQQKGYLLLIVTNQSGIGRGLFSLEDFHQVERSLNDKFARHNIHISKTYFCPHHPTEALPDYRKDCSCRKPKPGMLQQGLDDFHLDPQKCFMVGDKLSDVAAGQALGIPGILVQSGYGKLESKNTNILPNFTCETLLQAVETFIP
jgi:D-glycero-D-manno-heptose 1,7-bisphosphate phosphatase